MLALFTVFEHLTNVRRLLNRFHFFHTSPIRSTTVVSTRTKSNEDISPNLISIDTDQQRDMLLGPILNTILSDKRIDNFDEEFHDELQNQGYLARELDACLLEMREIERDILKLKQRQCYFYERYLDFIDKKDDLIEKFVEYYDQYSINNQVQSPTKHSRKQSSNKYEFNVPVSNRFALLKRQHTQDMQ
ncbi:unnamed protein product [Adineta steineri]|uniref:Uncharacterized protein n=1 Tax=Adineta steineri TaxID=433720 RepID=A0A815YIS0_9BILA|nr:unnamed protein product [Adineta steineri]CAF1571358.1 unnamed protein product [Adineta steineri]CAF1669116.1 unnamed protein product [Adineta steineri]CAF1669131.1 unnamed protein product [Adineta steineri]